MQNLSKEQTARREQIYGDLTERESALNQAVVEFNLLLEERLVVVQEAQTSFNDSVARVNDFIGEIRDAQETYADCRSEKWRETEAGEAYASWMNDWDIELDEVDLDLPEPLDEPGTDSSEQFLALPDSK